MMPFDYDQQNPCGYFCMGKLGIFNKKATKKWICVSTFNPSYSDHVCFDHISSETSQSTALEQKRLDL